MDMKGCNIISHIPNKLNLRHAVSEKPADLLQVLQPILLDICAKGLQSNRYLIFCRTYEDTVAMFREAVLFLHERSSSYVGDNGDRVCDKYDASTPPDLQESIISSFTNPVGPLRLVIATIAFAMGLDASNVLYKRLSTGDRLMIEMYVQ